MLQGSRREISTRIQVEASIWTGEEECGQGFLLQREYILSHHCAQRHSLQQYVVSCDPRCSGMERVCLVLIYNETVKSDTLHEVDGCETKCR